MSLFQAREWWAIRNGSGEEFDQGCMCIGNIDNESGENDKIVTGSFQGYIRIFYPRQSQFKVEDLLLEDHLDHPILQVAVGKFIQNSNQNALAVLHPRLLSVYIVESMGNSYYKLNKRYEHRLGVEGEHFTAFNFCYGPFGGATGRDLICVQSLDGQLQFFEQENYAFIQQLETCLVPGPICYAHQTDSLITANSEMIVECYKYQVLASSVRNRKSSEEAKKADEKGFTRAKKIQIDWTVNVGECVVDIRIARYSKTLTPSQFDILVLGQFTLFLLKSQGGIRMQKRLGYSPSICCLYTRPDTNGVQGGNQNVIISTHSKKWMIYQDTQLIWSACAPSTAVALGVAQFGSTPGMIVALDEEGMLTVNYLGTDPPCNTVGSTESKDINYEEMDEEHRQLLSVIREAQGDNRTEPREKILLRTQVPEMLDSANGLDNDLPQAGFVQSQDGTLLQVTVRLFVSYTGSGCVRDVNLAIQTPDNVVTPEPSLVLPLVDGKVSTPLVLFLVFRANSLATPTSRTVRVAAVHMTDTGQPRTTICEIELPLCICCRLIPPVKSNTFKFTLDTNKLPPLLTDLYEDLLTQPGATPEWIQRVTEASANVLSYQYFNGEEVTILVSKNAGRYRIQAAVIEALYFIAQDLVSRLAKHYASSDNADDNSDEFTVTYEEPLPLADFFAVIDEHFECRKKIRILLSDINDQSHQFRVIQKRLLVRFKERNPAPLHQLDALLNQTYENLIDLANKMEALQNALKLISNRLSCAIHLILMLIRYRFKLDDESFQILSAHLSPHVVDSADQGWEELTDASMTALLRTVLARQSKETAPVPQVVEFPDDTKKLKKHITIVCDRLAKGATLKA